MILFVYNTVLMAKNEKDLQTLMNGDNTVFKR